MPYFNVGDAQLYYEDYGQGQPIIFIHGVWMSSRFFKKQIPYFAERHRIITVDMRGHGRSAKVHTGHTIAAYARDVHTLIQGLALKDVILLGWSMGAFVVWDYVKQFGTKGLKATVIVEESASDYKKEDWPLGAFDFQELCEIMATVQTDRAAFVHELITAMFKDAPAEEDRQWMFDEITRLPESIASAILFDQTVQDYRPVLPSVSVPSLLCFGRDEKLIPIAAAKHLEQTLPDTRFVFFENSGHCPFLEEPDKFNQEVDAFIRSLS